MKKASILIFKIVIIYFVVIFVLIQFLTFGELMMLAYNYGRLLGSSTILAIFFGAYEKRAGALKGNLVSSILLIIFAPVVGFFHLSGVSLYKQRKKDITKFSVEEIKKQYKKRLISYEEYKHYMISNQYLIIEGPTKD